MNNTQLEILKSLNAIEIEVQKIKALLRTNNVPDVDQIIKTNKPFVSKSKAADILGVHRATVYNMVKDGRLTTSCDGKKISVLSICNYINSQNSGKIVS